MAKGKIEIDIQKCKGCGICIAACKHGVIALSHPKTTNQFGYRFLVTVKADQCTGCALCGFMCPDSAIEVYREEVHA